MTDVVEKLPVEVSLYGESDPLQDVPTWFLWISTLILTASFIAGLPLNGATVLIFWRRKKLRHLVNFVLLLDCLSHIILCAVCIPIHLVNVWSNMSLEKKGLMGASVLQQVVENFSNVYSTFLTVSIAILRYRRLCWKKRDKFSPANAMKWSLLSGGAAMGITFGQNYSSLLSDDQKTTLIFYLIKISLILLSVLVVFFCYIRVSQRVWANAASQKKVMDPIKLKKSRNVHLKATIHSCVQIILIIITLSPYLYQQSLETINICGTYCSSKLKLEDLPSLSNKVMDQESSRHAFHEEAVMMDESSNDEAAEERGQDDVLKSQQNLFAQEDLSTSSTPPMSTGHSRLFTRLIGITVNYTILILGTPLAYIASCHRFREQFASIFFSRIKYSPQNSGCNNPNSPRNCQHRNQLSSGCRSHCPPSPSPGLVYVRAEGRRRSSLHEGPTNGQIMTTSSFTMPRNSISLSTANTSTTATISKGSNGGSVKSRSSQRNKRRESRGLLGTDFIIVDSESTTMLHDPDLSNSTNPKETPTPSPTLLETSSSSSNSSNTKVREERRTSIFGGRTAFIATSKPEIGHNIHVQSILQNYAYDYTELGELV